MSSRTIYTCNICGKEQDATSVQGFWFETNEDEPRMIAPEDTSNVHICKDCQYQLSRALKRQAIDYTN